MHGINAYDTLQHGADEPAEASLHRVQDILEHIHHTNNMSEITAIGTNHAKIFIGLKDKILCSKLAESKVKKWNNMVQVLQDVAEMAIHFESSGGYFLLSFEINKTTAYRSQNPNSNQHYGTNKLQTKETQQPQLKPEKFKCWECQGNHIKKECPMVNTSHGKSKHSRFQDNKEKQCKLLKSFQKQFLNKERKQQCGS